jgi:hypothetical protein
MAALFPEFKDTPIKRFCTSAQDFQVVQAAQSDPQMRTTYDFWKYFLTLPVKVEFDVVSNTFYYYFRSAK